MPLRGVEISTFSFGKSWSREEGRRNYRLGATAEPVADQLARALRPAKLAMPEGTTRIILCPREIAPDPAGPKVMGDNLVVPVDLDWPRYEAVEYDHHGVGAFHTDLFRRGLEGMDKVVPGIGEIAERALADFEAVGYRYLWAPCKPKRGPDKCVASLEGCVDPFAFRLWLRVERRGETLFDAAILEDHTHSIYWHHKFKGLKWDGSEVHVTPRSPADGPPLFVFDARS